MAKVETKTAIAVELELPPNGGDLSVISTLEEDAHYLRVTLDKAENFKVAAGQRLLDLLVNKFGNNRNALRDWYEENVAEGKAHRAWSSVQRYMGIVRKYGDDAAAIFDDREEARRAQQYEYDRARGRITQKVRPYENEIKEPDSDQPICPGKSEYDLRKEWLSDMNVRWFKGEREWQDRWLQDRGLSRNRSF